MTPSVPVGELRALGDRALLIGVPDATAGRALARVMAGAFDGAADVVCGIATVMVHATDPDTELRSLWATAAGMVTGVGAGVVESRPHGHAAGDAVEPGRLVTIPCRFDGPDVAEVAALGRCAPDEVAELLTAQPLTVAVVGFSPGFAYLGGLPAQLERVPRRARPRPVVPAGSVAIANGHAAVYPTASPGGWNLVGRTGFPLFSPERRPFAVLAPGDRVRFTVAGAGEQVEPAPVTAPPWSVPPEARPVFEVVAPGLRAVVQDGGRHAVAPVGVPGAGPADPVSFALANRLAGNARDAGTLELTGGGTRLRCLGPCHVAAVGAAPDVRVDGTPAPPGQLLPLVAGQVLEVGRQRSGWRTYLSVAGGFLGPEWFGSSASDELTRLGAGPLVKGAQLHAGPWAPPLGDHIRAGRATELVPDAPVHLRVVPGPHPEQFGPDALARLADAAFEVAPVSNRVGLRLWADQGGADRRGWHAVGASELDSQGVVAGAVQVPPDGDPVVLLPDHATLGGYPVLAVVVSADHGLLGQCAPGTTVRFVPTEPAAADEARRAARREMKSAVVGPYPLAVG